jgi:DNA-binding transcriptional LysR family regulator
MHKEKAVEYLVEIEQLRIFLAVAQIGNMTKAAEALHMSQPNMSVSIKKLERELDIDLFERGKKPMALTRSGSMFLDFSKDILDRFDQGIARIQSAVHSSAHTISVAATSYVLLKRVLRNLCDCYDNLSVKQSIMPLDKIVNAVYAGEVDIAIVEECDFPDLSWTFVHEARLGIMMSAQNPLCMKSSLAVKDLQNQSFIANTYEYSADFITQLCREAGFFPNIVCDCSDNTILGTLIEKNLGITVCDCSLPQNTLVTPCRVVPLENNVTKRFGVLTRSDLSADGYLHSFKQATVDFFKSGK